MSGTIQPLNEVQTTFGYGHPHYSPGHERHRFGSTAPIQQDFGIYNPSTGRFTPIVGVGIEPGQTTLNQFGIGSNMKPGDLGRPL